KLVKLFCHDCVKRCHCHSTVVTSSYCAELKFISCKGKRRGTVSVSCIKDDLGNLIDTELHIHVITFFDLDVTLAFKFVENGSHRSTYKDRHDCRRCFISTQAEVISCSRDAGTEDIGVSMYGLDGGYEERKEHQVISCAAFRCEQIHAGICNE